MANEKRQRQKEARQQKADEIAKLERQEVLRQRVLLVVLLAVLLGGALYLLSRGDSDDGVSAEETSSSDSSDTTDDTTEADDEAAAEAQAEAEALAEQIALLSPPPAGAAVTGETPCPAADGTSERTTSFENPPPMCIDPTVDYTAIIATDLGDITIDLDEEAAPQTVNNFVVLARYGYYEDVPFHRIIPGFVIQGGDAVGGGDPEDPTLGAGNPGYAIDDELPAEGDYQIGSVAMANSGPDTNGSQFFIITGESGVALDPLYSLFGQVIEGQDVVEALDAIGTAPEGVPTELVTIRSVMIVQE